MASALSSASATSGRLCSCISSLTKPTCCGWSRSSRSRTIAFVSCAPISAMVAGKSRSMPNGPLESCLNSLMQRSIVSGLRLPHPITPRPPASVTAAASRGGLGMRSSMPSDMPASSIGYLIPSNSVSGEFSRSIISSSLPRSPRRVRPRILAPHASPT